MAFFATVMLVFSLFAGATTARAQDASNLPPVTDGSDTTDNTTDNTADTTTDDISSLRSYNNDDDEDDEDDDECDESNYRSNGPRDNDHDDCDDEDDDECDESNYRSNGPHDNGHDDCDDKEDTATIIATKIVCTDESDLPNWGPGGADITANTASNWVANHKSCSLASGWSFQWGPENAKDSGNTTLGAAASPWKAPFGPTNASGVATTLISEDDIEDNDYLWFREVLQDNYLPFTYDSKSDSPNGNNVSAEVYCSTDVKNYDNYDRIENLEEGETYYCVAWNVPEPGLIVVEKVVEGSETEQTFPFTASWTENVISLADGGTYTSPELAMGTYSVFENVPEGWNKPEVSCVSSQGGEEVASEIDLDAGETVTCTFTNSPEPVVTPKVCKIGDNLLKNASFETPVPTTNGGDWQIFGAVTDWLISSSGLEIWANGFFGGASDGEQNAELDGNESTTISQNVTTIPGALYELRFDFSPRPDVAGNSLNALAGGEVIKSVSASGIGKTETEWTTYEQTFTATTTSTDIAFADTSVSDSYGTVIDNAVLCLVREPEPQSCSVTVVSDATNTVTEKDGAFAKVLSWIHPAWTASISGASWIWGDNPIANPVPDTIQTFTKEFVWDGPVTEVSLMIAADNSYTARLNGQVIGSSTAENNHALSTQDTYTTFSGVVVTGTNTLEIEVKNWAQNGATVESNPAGLLYKLVVTGTDATCSEVPGDGGGDGDGDGGDNGGSSSSSDDSGNNGGSGKKISLSTGSNDDEGEVLGDTDTPTQAGEVLGAVAPTGAPNTGMGGTAQNGTFATLLALAGIILGLCGVRRTV
jgi:hypothetical protein